MYLHRLHLVSKPYPATYCINKSGIAFLKEHSGYKLQHDYLQKMIKNLFKSLYKSKRKLNVKKSVSFPNSIGDQINKYNEGLRSRLLEIIVKKEDPFFFEQLVVDLLAKMGYKGRHGSAIRTQDTQDGGIDGIINQDPLGTSTVYIQAKRYNKKHIVGSPAIQGFFGAIRTRNASRGVFITTSDFSKRAKELAKRFSIVAINGEQLSNLLLEYQVGVQVEHDYQILKIDKDFFD
ncbi:restriction endonuclease [uncultured bacterium]|uniref:Restriction endonuclease n=2 Tax=Acetilactobacillus jinshanensis TaxID=1720083 RepID=A0A4P6ZMA1_9LACO|nr:restriction endonuclease [Acetilactobacillus jinshanensis]URL61908.1 restriction endonuclease [uncultured bacterium]